MFSPLVLAPSVAAEASITVYCSLEDVEEHGILLRNLEILKGEMDTIDSLCNVADTGISTIRAIKNFVNRVNPPQPLQPMSLVSQTTTSFSYTDGVSEPLNVLKSDSPG